MKLAAVILLLSVIIVKLNGLRESSESSLLHETSETHNKCSFQKRKRNLVLHNKDYVHILLPCDINTYYLME